MRNLSDNTDMGFYCIETENFTDAIVLTAGAAKPYIIPTGAKFLFFSSTALFYAKFSDDATANPASEPVGDVIDGTASILNPTGRKIAGATEVSLISPVDTIITITPMT